MKRYEQFSHTADIGVRVFGRTVKELFANAAFAMFDIIADLEGITGGIVDEFDLKAATPEELLVNWLDELLYRSCTKEIIFFDFEISELGDTRMKAKATGRSFAANRNRLKTEIKAATYSDLAIKKTAEGYSVEIVFDV